MEPDLRMGDLRVGSVKGPGSCLSLVLGRDYTSCSWCVGQSLRGSTIIRFVLIMICDHLRGFYRFMPSLVPEIRSGLCFFQGSKSHIFFIFHFSFFHSFF